MQYYRGDFAEESFGEHHPTVAWLIRWGIGLVVVTTLAYFGGIEYVIIDMLK